MNFMTKLLTDTTLLIGLTPLSPISQIFMDPSTPRQPRCELEHVMTSTVTCGDSSDHYLPSPHAGPASRGGAAAAVAVAVAPQKQTLQKQVSHKKESGAEYLVNIQHWSPGRVLASVFIYTFIRL